jgi:DNA-binding MarR family transcriptional regulator
MSIEREEFDRLLGLLEQVRSKLEFVHTPARDYDTGSSLYKVEIHTIQAIGENPGINSSALARRMGVTKSAVSQTLNKLDGKSLVRKIPSADARESGLELTELGWKGFYAHERFHAQIYEAARSYFGESLKPKMDTFTVTMTDFNEILSQYIKKAYCLSAKDKISVND